MSNGKNPEITLTFGNQQALVAPHGASLRQYHRIAPDGSEQAIVWGYSGDAHKSGGQGDVLIPFPGRVKQGRYAFEGRSYQMERNDKESPSAIHGFLRGVDWDTESATESVAAFRTALTKEQAPGYPFALDVRVAYSLDESGLSVEFEVRNSGDGPAPVGAGFHPYFTAGTDIVDEMEAQIPATRILEFDDSLTPTGRLLAVRGTPADFRASRRVGATRLNHCYSGLVSDVDGITRVRLRNAAGSRRVTVWMDAAFPYLVAYTGDTIPPPGNRRALAIEPMTCATDAFNHPDWGLARLDPGERLHGRFGAREEEA